MIQEVKKVKEIENAKNKAKVNQTRKEKQHPHHKNNLYLNHEIRNNNNKKKKNQNQIVINQWKEEHLIQVMQLTLKLNISEMMMIYQMMKK